MTTLEPEKKDILEKLNEIALEANWGTVDRVNGVPKAIAVIQEAVEEIKDLRKRIVFWRNDTKADEQVRKETAKEILSYLYEKMANSAMSDTELVKYLAIKYGVELDKNV